MKRRALLAGVAAGGALALAGCTDDDRVPLPIDPGEDPINLIVPEETTLTVPSGDVRSYPGGGLIDGVLTLDGTVRIHGELTI